jgi:alpha-1,3-glucosyltransferase
MLRIKDLNYDSWQTIYFQRSTVLISELFLLYALSVLVHLTHQSRIHFTEVQYRFVKNSPTKQQSYAGALAVFLSPGLLIIDHIHFQYNGFMYGILILSLAYAQNRSTLLRSGLLFAVLLCFKHIYLYLSPAYFVYLLRAYCIAPSSIFRIQWLNSIKLGVGIIAVFASAFGPFALWEQMPQVLSRLFPFSRGLCHAYWAPNIWALYSFADRVLIYRKSPHTNPLYKISSS